MIQIKEFDIILDIKDLKNVKYRDPVTQKFINEITVIREDYLGNQFNIYLEDGGQPYQIGENSVDIVFRKYDGTTIIMSTKTENIEIIDNVIKCILSTNIMAISGRQVQSEVIVRDAEGRQLTTARFGFRVQRRLLTDEVVESANELPLLNQLIGQVETLDKTITENESQRNQEFSNIVDTAITTKDGLDISIKNGIDTKTALDESIQTGGAIFKDVETLKGLRIYKGDIEPTDTPFWYDPTDSSTIKRK